MALYPDHHGVPDLHKIDSGWQNGTAIVKSITEYDCVLPWFRYCQKRNIDTISHDLLCGKDTWYS